MQLWSLHFTHGKIGCDGAQCTSPLDSNSECILAWFQLQTGEPVAQPRRQAAEQTQRPFSNNSAQRLTGAAASTDAGASAATDARAAEEAAGAAAPGAAGQQNSSSGLPMTGEKAAAAAAAEAASMEVPTAAKAAAAGPGAGPSTLQKGIVHTAIGGALVGVGVARGPVVAAAADVRAAGPRKQTGSRKGKRKKRKTVQQLPHDAPTLFGMDPQLKIGRGEGAELVA